MSSEISLAASLFHLAFVSVDLPFLPTVLFCDCSLQDGTVSYTLIEEEELSSLWTHVYANLPVGDANSCSVSICKELRTIYEIAVYSSASYYIWKRENHIDVLEAAAALLAVECAVQNGVCNQKLFLFPDSLVVLCALQEGRSS